jgi:hypothetical protein
MDRSFWLPLMRRGEWVPLEVGHHLPPDLLWGSGVDLWTRRRGEALEARVSVGAFSAHQDITGLSAAQVQSWALQADQRLQGLSGYRMTPFSGSDSGDLCQMEA